MPRKDKNRQDTGTKQTIVQLKKDTTSKDKSRKDNKQMQDTSHKGKTKQLQERQDINTPIEKVVSQTT